MGGHQSVFSKSQEKTLQQLLKEGAKSDYGIHYNMSSIRGVSDFEDKIPVGDYHSHKAFWGDFRGNYRSTWPGEIELLGSTSGTDQNGSKCIPVTRASMDSARKGFLKFMMSLWRKGCLSLKDVVFGKAFFMGAQPSGQKHMGYVSENMSFYSLDTAPTYIKKRVVPDLEWIKQYKYDELLTQIGLSAKQLDVYIVSGFPCWIIQVAQAILKEHGAINLKEVWPKLKVYLYSGMDIGPYKSALKTALGDIPFLETYVATEGFFGYRLPGEAGMRWNLDGGIYYEFLSTDGSEAICNAPEIGKNYQLVVSTNAGLWRYKTGDCIVMLNDFNFKFNGRVSDILNVMGELITSEQIQQVLHAISDQGKISFQFVTILPVLENGICIHYWLVASDNSISVTNQELDNYVRQSNVTYDGYRANNKGMSCARLVQCDASLFKEYLKTSGKLHLQAKIPLVQPVNQSYFKTYIDHAASN